MNWNLVEDIVTLFQAWSLIKGYAHLKHHDQKLSPDRLQEHPET